MGGAEKALGTRLGEQATTHVCKANGKPGSALAMESKGVARILRQSVELC